MIAQLTPYESGRDLRSTEAAEEAKTDQPGEAEQWRLLRMVDESGSIPDGALIRAWEQKKSMPVDLRAWQAASPETSANPDSAGEPSIAGIQPSGWTWLGPGNIGGRIRSIIIHPTNSQTMWIGSVSGGIWKTTDGGATWSPLADFMANLAVNCIAIDPSNPNVLYAGTGEGFYNVDSVQGAGIFKTTDGGSTWTQLSSTTNSNWYYVNRIAINPNNSQIVLAATRSGIWRSTDGGATWSNRLSTNALDLDFNPTDGSKCIASGLSNSYYSTDGGITWTTATGLPAAIPFPAGRVELAYARSNPLLVYASVDNNEGEVYLSSDGGHSFVLRNSGTHYFNAGGGDQGWYDNIIWVDPTNSGNLVVGGIFLWRSTNGGTSLTQIGSLHADQHAIVESPQFNGTTNKTVFFGNDGGIYQTGDIYAASPSMTSLNNGLGITQFYSGAGNTASGRIIGGAQDNFTLRYSGSAAVWSAFFCCDGGFSAADQTDPNFFYGESQWMGIFRSIDGGQFASYINSGISDAKPQGTNFISPFILDPNNPNTLLAGGLSLWRSTNVKATTTAPIWTAIKSPLGSDYRTFSISAIAVAKGNSNIIWVGHDDGDVYYTTNGTATSPSWTRADLGSPALPDRYCARITIDPTYSGRVYVTFGGFNSGNVWRTDNNGATWTNVSGNLPSAPVYTLAVWQQNANYLYVGTEVGIFASADGGQSWSPSNDGPTNCSVDELFWMGDTLVAATHGRGMFSINVASQPTAPLPPTAQAATSVTSSGFTANWGGSSGATGYRLDVSTSSAFSSYVSGYQNLDVGNVLSRAVSGLSAGTTYYYRVRAYNGVGTSDNSSVITVATTTQSSQSELITNGTFASGSTSWTLSGNFFADSRFTNCHSCPGYAYVSNSDGTPGNSLTGIMYQSVSVPSNATSATVSFWYNITTQETTTSTPFDVLNVTLQNSSGGLLSTVATFSNLNATSGYVQKSVSVDLTPYRGQTIRLNFLGTTDSSFPTVFRVDDVSMLATLVSLVPSAPVAGAATSVTVSGFTANWGGSSGATGYRLDVSSDSSFGSFVSGYQNLDVGNVQSKAVSGLSAGTTYYYRVRAYNSAGTSGSSNVVNLITVAQYTITLNASPSAGGTVGGGGTFAAGSSRTVTATANSGYTFSNWTENGSVVSSSSSYTFTLNGNRNLVANFTANPVNYTIAVSASPSGGGAVSGGGTFVAGSSVTVTASANSGYTFANWTENGSVVSSSASYNFTLNGNRTLVANFTANPVNYTITVSASPSAGGTVSGGGTFASGSTSTVTAIPNSGYTFTNWTEGGSVVSSSASYTFTLNSNRNLVANFATQTTCNANNLALSCNGAVASASSSFNSNYPASAVNNGDRRGLNWNAGGGWNDATPNSYPDWVQIDFNASKTVSEVDIFTLQDNPASPVEPGDTMTFTQYGVTAFDVQYWNGSAWVTVSGGSVTGNNLVWRKVSFSAVVTSKIRVLVNAALAGYSRLTEVEAYSVASARTNVALARNGATATASSSYGPGYPASAVNNGERAGINWNNGGGWNDATSYSYPDWVQVSFNGVKTINEIDVFTLQDNPANPAEPTDAMTFTQYGITSFDVQYWDDGAGWVTVPNGSVTGNDRVKRVFSFSPVTTGSVRILIQNSLAGFSRVTEVEAYEAPGGTPPRNDVALSSNGATAAASSTYGTGYAASSVIDGDRKGTNWNNGGGWNDATYNSYPDWVQVNFSGYKRINEIGIYTLQDNPTSPLEPGDGTTFSLYGVTDFRVEYWDDFWGWVTVPNGDVTANRNVKRSFPISAVMTNKVRVWVTGSLAGYSRITEVEALEASPNVASASNGAVASASSSFSSNYPASAVNNGDRAGMNWNNGGGWNDATVNSYPDWVQVDFAGSKTIREMDVFTLQDNPASPVEPNGDTLFTLYGVTAFDVQYWNGSGWVTVPGGSVTGNIQVWRRVTFPAVTTSKIRVVVNNSLGGYSRLTEIEAY